MEAPNQTRTPCRCHAIVEKTENKAFERKYRIFCKQTHGVLAFELELSHPARRKISLERINEAKFESPRMCCLDHKTTVIQISYSVSCFNRVNSKVNSGQNRTATHFYYIIMFCFVAIGHYYENSRGLLLTATHPIYLY